MTVSTVVELPESLHLSVQEYLETHKYWDQERVMQAALSLFLMQNGVNNPGVNRTYLETLFNYQVGESQ